MPLRNRSKWFESIFAILRIGKSLELTMASFKLLNELDKCFPWVHLSAAADEMKSSSELSLIVENEVWFVSAMVSNI
ncbi:negative regulator of systemic acquired resistance SNI1-like isoform X3 [Argentina anserina]|uniref:negative regulator of systemic acquired resistance SNI1-like isoform X3 n=1 Tax=Argentina anserina TaxID=57926 RepID=UPI002176630A|nr:negative regulator of systemic acquired resistance SNI1-like isoform X3 [Potentilla anserina]XP_050368273.1 negative regulator of systemic acquired resistance SNI1-like isoform X3 [Potentilla anserina]XP_050384532.1 negative regulator of systemic acquired resistance SNI1-like isoform X3 [Potentilla anserina]